MRSRGGVFLLIIVILVIGFSFYRGYLTLTSQPLPASNNTEIKLIVDQEKLKSDTHEASSEVKRLTGNEPAPVVTPSPVVVP